MTWTEDERRQFRSLLLASPVRFEAFHRAPLFRALVEMTEPLLDLVAAESLAVEEQSLDWIRRGAIGQDGPAWKPLSDLGKEQVEQRRLAIAAAGIPSLDAWAEYHVQRRG